MKNNNQPHTPPAGRQNDPADALMQELRQLWDQRDARLASAMEEEPMPAPRPAMAPAPSRKAGSRRWRYRAAAAAVLLAGVAAWLALRQPASAPVLTARHLPAPEPQQPLQAAHRPEATARPAARTAAPAAQRKAVAAQDEVPAADAAPVQDAETVNLTDVITKTPADELFAALDEADQQTYVRCNNLCDAREIWTRTKTLL